MPKVSVIIPVYNTELYLRKCIDSVRNQTLKDIEIICVDDGSTDSSPDILEDYALKDSRIKVIHKVNGGLVSARKAGIAMATGLYTGYVDSDDWIEPDMYEELYHTMQDYHVELVTCGYYLEGNYTTEHLDTLCEGYYCGDKMIYLRNNTIYRLECRETGIRGGLWCKLFSTTLLKKVQEQIPDAISIAEDKVCLLRYILESSSVYVLRKPFYHWIIRQSSMSHESNEQHNDYLMKINHVYNYLMTLYSHPNFTDYMRYQSELYVTELLFLGINKRMGFKNKNMIWIDPYWLEQIPKGSKIVLYGAGELGEKYCKQLCTRPDVDMLACVDPKYEMLSRNDFPVCSPLLLPSLEYDFIVITIKNPSKAEEVRKELQDRGISQNKIIWCEQPEVYWRYAKAEGII